MISYISLIYADGSARWDTIKKVSMGQMFI